jgi:hypothetical protein
MYGTKKHSNMKQQINIIDLKKLFASSGTLWHRLLESVGLEFLFSPVKKRKILTLVLSVFMVSISIQAFSQTETFDIATYTPPEDWKKDTKSGVINYTNVNTATGGFCVIAIYASTVSTGDAQKDFKKDWKDLVVTPYKAIANPQTETQTTDDGWKIVTAAAPVKSDGTDVYILLTVVSGFGETMSIRSSFNDQSYTVQLDALFETMELDKTKTVTVNNTQQPADNTTSAVQTTVGSEKFGLMLYSAPAGWSHEQYPDGVVFKPVDIPAGEHLAIQIMTPLNFTGNLEQALAQSFEEATTMYKGSSMYQSGGKYSKNASAISFNGWEYIRGKGGIRINDGTQFGTEYGLELFVIKINNRFERVAVLESRKYCGGSSLYYTSDRRAYRNGIEHLLFSLHFTDFIGRVLSPGAVTGSGIVGLWQGTIQSTTASGIRLEVLSPIFLSNGQVYFGSKFPTEGLAGINTQLPPQLNNRDWGTYTFSNGTGAIQMPYGKIPIRKEGNQIILTKNQKDWPFYQLPSVNGATFTGTYTMGAVNGKIPSISFTANGKFTDNGALKELYHEYVNCLNPAATPGSGTYEVKDYTILFNYSDGRKIRIAFLGAGYDRSNPAPQTLRMSFNEDPMTRQ